MNKFALTLISHGRRPLSVSRSWTQKLLFVAETRLIILRSIPSLSFLLPPPPPPPCLFSNDALATLAWKEPRAVLFLKSQCRSQLGLERELGPLLSAPSPAHFARQHWCECRRIRDVNRNRSRFSVLTEHEEETARARNCGDTSLQKAQQRPEVIHEHRCRVLERVLLLTRNPWWTLTDFTYEADTVSPT